MLCNILTLKGIALTPVCLRVMSGCLPGVYSLYKNPKNRYKLMLSARFYLIITAMSGLLSVALGAFGAHGLKALLSSDMLAAYQTGVQYQFTHTLVLLGLAVLLLTFPASLVFFRMLKVSANLMLVGILLFSGSLYTMAFMSVVDISSPTWLGPITPIGGLAFILGWVFLAIAAFKLPV